MPACTLVLTKMHQTDLAELPAYVAASKASVARRIKEMAANVEDQLMAKLRTCTFCLINESKSQRCIEVSGS